MSKKVDQSILDSLMITIFTLSTINTPLQQEKILNKCGTLHSKPYKLRSNLYLSNNSINNVTNTLLTSLDSIFNKSTNNDSIDIEDQKIQQYLRRFSFLYQSFVLKVYPNDLSEIKNYKVNSLALRNLYILSNL